MADESDPPQHSLPSYHEPTPETHRRMSREEEAELALGHTEATRGVRAVVTILLLATIATVPVINLAARLRNDSAKHGPPGAEVLALLPNRTDLAKANGPGDLWRMLPTGEEIKAAEKSVERESIVSQYLLPTVQSFLTETLRAGNEQAYPGRPGWLFYRTDVDYVAGPAFLDPARLRHRARDLGIQPDPVRAIIDFRDQLAARGVELVVVPVPTKASIEASMLSPRAKSGTVLQNPSYDAFKTQLATAGVAVFDPTTVLSGLRGSEGKALYLETDTHWRPETMQAVAQALATAIKHPRGNASYQLVPREVQGMGDIALLLKLRPDQTIYKPQKVTVQQVQAGTALWRPSPDADVLLLGDSFSNIYSLEGMGWGESAGFAEHLSHALGKPIDAILRNSDAAFATREILSRELARGRDRLKGKKLVIWEYAQRELAFGNWKLLPMTLGHPSPSAFFSVKGSEQAIVAGTVAAVSTVPRPGTVPYKDHILSVHLIDLEGGPADPNKSLQAVAHTWSMRDNVWTSAARLRPGDRVKLRVSSWAESGGEREKINRSELDDPALQLEEPIWAELIN